MREETLAQQSSDRDAKVRFRVLSYRVEELPSSRLFRLLDKSKRS